MSVIKLSYTEQIVLVQANLTPTLPHDVSLNVKLCSAWESEYMYGCLSSV